MAKKPSKTVSSESPVMGVWTADWHTQDKAWVGRPELCGDSYYAVRQIIEFAVEHRVDVLAAGDLADRKSNEADVVNFLRQQIEELSSAGCRLFYTQGQHEFQSPTPWLSAIHEKADWLDPASHVGSVTASCGLVQGFDWTPATKLQEKLELVQPETRILVLHQTCDEFMGGLIATEVAFDMIPYVKYLLIGDYHKTVCMRAKGRHGQIMQVVSPGSTCLQAIDESPDKFFYTIHADGSLKAVKLKSRHVLKSPDIMDEEGLNEFVTVVGKKLDETIADGIAEGLPTWIQKPILKVRFNLQITDAYRRIVRAVGDTAHLFYEGMGGTQAEVSLTDEKTQRQVAASQGLLGCLDLVVKQEEDPELHAFLTRILEGDPKQEILKERRRFRLDDEDEDEDEEIVEETTV
jgi:DNA repair exonuclease SbcCD nuclease subunit